jgi:hypothetical protein
MMKKEKCKCNACNIDFSSDNGYGYVLDELKATRAQIDKIIDVIEKRIEKDALINDILNTDYEDDYCDSLDEIKQKKDSASFRWYYPPYKYRYPLKWNNTYWFY